MKNDYKEKDIWRKRVIAVVAEYLKKSGKNADIKVIIGVALKALSNEYSNFNQVPKNRLINLYNAFLKKNRDFSNVENLTEINIINFKNIGKA